MKKTNESSELQNGISSPIDYLRRHNRGFAVGTAALLLAAGAARAATHENHDQQLSNTTISQEAAPQMVEIDTVDGTTKGELLPATQAEVLETLDSDLESLQIQGAWWVGGQEIDGEIEIFGGTGLYDIDQYTKPYEEDYDIDSVTDVSTYFARQTVNGYIQANGSAEQVRALSDFNRAVNQAADAASAMSAVYNEDPSGQGSEAEKLGKALDAANQKAEEALAHLIELIGGQ